MIISRVRAAHALCGEVVKMARDQATIVSRAYLQPLEFDFGELRVRANPLAARCRVEIRPRLC
jgi:hypothetical protein